MQKGGNPYNICRMLVGVADNIPGSQGHQDCGAWITRWLFFFSDALRLPPPKGFLIPWGEKSRFCLETSHEP